MVANIKGFARFTKRNRRICEIFTQGVRKFWGHGRGPKKLTYKD